MTHQEVDRLLRAIVKLWPTVPFATSIDADLIRLWQLVLADVPLDAAELVIVLRARADERFPPTPGGIVSDYHGLCDQAAGRRTPDADEAWGEVRRTIGRCGYDHPPTVDSWSHPAVAAAVSSIGWGQLCRGDEQIVRAHFLRSYPAIAQRARADVTFSRATAALGLDTTSLVRAIESAVTPDV